MIVEPHTEFKPASLALALDAASIAAAAGDPAAALIHGHGPMVERIRTFDWSANPLGSIAGWSETLLCTVNIILACHVPCAIWGPGLVQIYNDDYRVFLGEKDAEALGQLASECWAEAWEIIGPLVRDVIDNGASKFFENMNVPVNRNGKLQDVYWTYSYSPIYRPNGEIIGLLVIARDTTELVMTARRLKESEDRANRVLRSIGDAVIVTDADSRVTGMNPVAETLTGSTEAECRGRDLAEVFHVVDENTRLPIEDPAKQVKRQGIASGLANPAILIGRDGKETIIDDNSAPIHNDDGHLTGSVVVFRDITERRATERQRDAVKKELEHVLDATNDGILSINRDWRITYLNPKAAETLDPADTLGKDFWAKFPYTIYDDSPYVKHYNDAMLHGIPSEFEAYYPEPINATFWLIVRPFQDGFILFFRDVSEQHREAAALRESESRLSAIYSTAVGFIGLLSPDGEILDCNRAALKLGGATREKLNGLRYWQGPWFSYTKGMPDMVQRAVVRAASGEFVRQELSLVRPSGKIITFDFSISPVRNDQGEVIFLVPEGHDISALKSTRAELAASREELHWTVELSTPIPWTSDIEGNILDFSRSFLELTGLNRDQVVGKGWMQALHPEDLNRVIVVWTDSLRSGQPVDVEYRLRTASQEFRWVRARANPRRDVFGVIVKWYGTIEDVDERKNAEDALVRNEVLAAIDLMARQLSEQIKEPLASVHNLLTHAESLTTGGEIQSFVINSNRELRRLLDSTDQMLQLPIDIARLSTNREHPAAELSASGQN